MIIYIDDEGVEGLNLTDIATEISVMVSDVWYTARRGLHFDVPEGDRLKTAVQAVAGAACHTCGSGKKPNYTTYYVKEIRMYKA